MLSTALLNANAGLAATSQQLSVISRNISNAGNVNATTKTAVVQTGPTGNVLVAGVRNSTDSALLEMVLDANSAVSASQVTDNGLSQLQNAIGDISNGNTPSALLGNLQSALQTYAASPSSSVAADAVITAAKSVSQGLNSAATAVTNVQQSANQSLASAVNSVNSLLAQFGTVNTAIVAGTAAGQDVTDQIDQRSGILQSLSQYLGVQTVASGNNDMALYTDSGVTLFNQTAQTVTLNTSVSSSSPSVSVGGVVIAGTGQTMPLGSGSIRALVDLRDGAAATMGAQLNEIARGLVNAFAETTNSGGSSLPSVPGLFTAPGLATVPGSSGNVAGLAATISINAAYDPAQGGSATLVRDSGSAGAVYDGNPSGGSGDATHINALINGLSANQTFADACIETNTDLLSYSASSVGWLASQRQASSSELTQTTAVQAQAANSLSSDVGVSLDQQMSNMMSLENSYQASSRLITAIDSLFNQLINAVGA